MKKVLICFILLSATVTACFANGRCEKLEKEILKNPTVQEVKVAQYDKWSQEIYFADIYLKNGGFLTVCEFERDLSGKRLYVEYIGLINMVTMIQVNIGVLSLRSLWRTIIVPCLLMNNSPLGLE